MMNLIMLIYFLLLTCSCLQHVSGTDLIPCGATITYVNGGPMVDVNKMLSDCDKNAGPYIPSAYPDMDSTQVSVQV